MHAANVHRKDRCSVTDDDYIKRWLADHQIEDVEAFVPDMAGVARGKLLPADKMGYGELKMPEGIFSQKISGSFVNDPDNVEDRDMLLDPDPSTLRIVPWASDPAASIFLDCYKKDDSPVMTSPRTVLRHVLDLYREKGWTPVVAPEVEFYLINAHSDPNAEVEPPEGRLGRTEGANQPYSIDGMNEFDPFINTVYEYCEAQDIRIDALTQEMGPGQFEINFLHGDAIQLADQVLLFKRTVKEAAIQHEMHATFLSRPISEEAGSALHIHQSVLDEDGKNIFSNADGSASDAFMHYIGGLQRFMPEALLMFAPYPNSYRRFLSYYASPVNLEWAVDNRTVGLRVPDSEPDARRVENRLAGSDVNPYLAMAGTLACGFLGMTEGWSPREEISGTAYDLPFALHKHMYAAIDAMQNSKAMRQTLGDAFVDLYCFLKEEEYREFQEIVTPWEREILLFNV